ncbi:TonB-dependent receptor [uncultured Pseudacidovorax sp.]|uniref:TonB-dependent receptor n=1 Tax=uncultured Pseudacidovorax sp. TaxID=679313 RepID=UPI0025CF1B96|nr:TonB-dependent receptor [uncultured Pseudacidovorax sp.]
MTRLFTPGPLALAAGLALQALAASAQTPPAATTAPTTAGTLSTVTVEASADASAEGLTKPYAGGQVARGGRVGLLGNVDLMATPFATTAYTQELIQNQQARSVADVLQNDPSVRVARGFGNFQESYFMRGFIVNSDDIAYNGLYGLLPRQYIASELFERVEVLRGASAFLNGATPSGGGIGGNINLLPKRAGNEPLTQVTVGGASGSQGYAAADIARRFGQDQSLGVRVNAAHRDGGTGVDGESVKLSALSVGLDWRGRDARVSADIGHQEHMLEAARPNVTLGSAVTVVPRAPDGRSNYAQPWTYSMERDTFGSLRGEYDITPAVTAWAAAGARRSAESNALANPTVNNAFTGASTATRFDNTREDDVKTAELGLRGKLRTGSVGHEWVLGYSWYDLQKKNAYAMGLAAGSSVASSIYTPVARFAPGLSYLGNDLTSPALNGTTTLKSWALGDTLSFLGDRLRVTLGARYQTLESTSIPYVVANAGRFVAGSTGISSYDQSRTSPVAGVVFRLQDNLSIYANYIEGLAQGDTAPTATNGVVVVNGGQALAPYVSKQKEVGLKYDGGRIGATVAVFSTEKPRAYLDTATGIFSARGEDRHQGVELNTFGEITRGLRVLGGVTWLDAEQKNTGSATTDGKRVIGVARAQGSLGLEWDVPGVPGLALTGRVVRNGSSYADAANTLRVPGWTRLDVGARYLTEVAGKPVTFRARIDNATDRNYWASVGGYPGYGYLVQGAPRTFNVSATVDF